MEIMRHIFRTGAILIVLSGSSLNLHSQVSPFDPSLSDQAALIRERVNGFTDRSLYITGEQIRFWARVQTAGLPGLPDLPGLNNWSSVLYVELVTPEGNAVTQGKFRMDKQASSGEIRIPEGILSGPYVFRCYTRWMRNRDPGEYCYIPIRIINPNRPELVTELSRSDGPGIPGTRSARTGAVDYSGISAVYDRNDSVGFELFTTGTGEDPLVEGCLTVVPLEVRPSESLEIPGSSSKTPADFHLNFLPDLYGASLSGTLLDPASEERVVPGARVHFTLMGQQSGYFTGRADALGKFSVTLPGREGKLELLVQPENNGSDQVEVRIDQDFDSRNFPLYTGPFTLNGEEKHTLTVMARKVQLSRIYGDRDSTLESQTEPSSIPFYGTPSFSLNMDEFVLLPTLEEVFINLVPLVTPMTRQNRTTLIIESENHTMSLFKPLLMIDQVPFFNADQFMSVAPERIRSIDVVNDLYLKGDQMYGGIINLRSKEHDIAGTGLPGNAFFIDVLGLHSAAADSQSLNVTVDHQPDTRNTLLWVPDLQLNRQRSRKISFLAPDYPGEYMVLFRGVDGQGEYISAESVFRIR